MNAAIELGGTNINIAIFDQGKIIEQTHISTQEPEVTLGLMIDWLAKRQFENIGIASFGPLCLDKQSENYGAITSTPKVKWQYYPLCRKLSEALKKPFFVDTDVNACAMAEYQLGNHKVKSSLGYITVGTGVGVGLIVNGECVHGLMHPEGGHIRIPKYKDDALFPGVCAFHGDCLEGLCTNISIAKRLNLDISELHTVSDDHPVWDAIANYLAILSQNLLLILSIEKIVIGGGVMNRKILYEKINVILKQLTNAYVNIPENYVVSPSIENIGLVDNIPQVKRNKIQHFDVPESQEGQDMIAYAQCCYCCGEFWGFLRIWMPCIFCCCVEYPFKEVEQGFEGLFKRYGRYLKVVRPGLHYVNPCTDSLDYLDLRITVIDLDRQSVLTKDNVTINIDASVYYRIKTARYAVYRVENYDQAVRQITYAVLKNTVGGFTLQDLLEKRQQVADEIEDQVDHYVRDWGVIIDNIYMKDIQLTADLQQALSSAATEQRLAKGKIISAKADVEAAKLMKQASEYLDSKTAMQVRYLETLNMLASGPGTKVCFIPDEKDKQKLLHNITQGLLA